MVENVIQIKSGIMINVDASAKSIIYVKKDYIWNPATCSCENGKYFTSIVDNSVIMCNDIIDAEERKTIPKILSKKFLYLISLLPFYLALLTAFSIYFCLIKYKAKQRHLLPYYLTNDKLINIL